MVDCSKQHTVGLGVINETPYEFEICYAQGTCRYNVPSPYVKDTGVQVTGQNTRPGGHALINDLCSNKGILIAATAGLSAIKVKYPDGSTRDFHDSYPECADGKYYPQLVWRLHTRPMLTTNGRIEESVTLSREIDAEEVTELDLKQV